MDRFLATHGTLENASRLPRPPGMGMAYENLGVSFVPPGMSKPKKPIPSTQGSYSKFKPATSTKSSSSQPIPSTSQRSYRSRSNSTSRSTSGKNNRNPPKETIVLSDADSESSDEIDFLSSQADEEEDFRDVKKKTSGQSQAKKGKAVSGSTFVDEKGKQHAYDPKFPPKKKFAGLKFTKTKKPEQAADDSLSKESGKEQYSEHLTSRNSRLTTDKTKSTATTSKTPDCDDDVVYVSPLSGKSANSNRRTSPIPSRILPFNASQPRPIPRPKNGSRPAPFSQSKSTFGPRSSQTNPPSSSAAPLNMITLDTSSQTNVALEPDSRYRTWSESPERSEQKALPDAFPDLSPPSSPIPRKRTTLDDFPFMSPLGGTKLRAEPTKPQASSSRIPSLFPMPSPQSKAIDEPKTKTGIQTTRQKNKGKEKVQTSLFSEEESAYDLQASEKRKREKKKSKKLGKKAEAFPMSTQVLASIGSPTAPSTWSSSPAGPSRSGKRMSECGSEDERVSKRSKTEREALLQSPTRLFDDEGDSICISPHVDPRTLCPYCDTPLPSSPSPLLQNILAATRKKSKRDPRPSNPLGLKAPLASFIAVCQRHRFESQILPEAEKKGWPKTIEWNKLGGRIAKMKGMLQSLIEDTGQHEDEVDDDWEVVVQAKIAKSPKKGAKARSLFWTEIMAEIKSKGLRAVSGVRGQFANFEKAQPGYYGELGSVIIHQTLYNMFPPASMDANFIAPLTANEFVQRILVPEVALHLIMEDKGFEGDEEMKEALTILRESSTYGVAMFPEDGGEWDKSKKQEDNRKMGVGDRIVMERARKRRKELEEEEEREERERSLAKEQQARPRPRPRPVAKCSSSMSVLALAESSDERSIRSNGQHAWSDMDTDAASEVDSAIGIGGGGDDVVHQRTSARRDRSLSASETKRQTPVPTTRATSRGLSLESDSDTSGKAVVGEKRPHRRSPLTTTSRKATKSSARKIQIVSSSESDGVVEVTAQTPVQKGRFGPGLVWDDETTPKPSLARSELSSDASLPPLLRARNRVKIDTGTLTSTTSSRTLDLPQRNTRAGSSIDSIASTDSDDGGSTKRQPPVDYRQFGWLLSSSQSFGEGTTRRK